MCVFPIEIVEKILYYCDGETLLAAELVSKQWRDIVRYLGLNTDVWKKSIKDIPRNDLVCMKAKLMYPVNDTRSYETIFRNWFSWKYYKKSTKATVVVQDETLFSNVTCIRASGDVIVFGNTKGHIYFFNSKGTDIMVKNLSYTILNLEFFNDVDVFDENTEQLRHSHLLVHHGRIVTLLNLKKWPEVTTDSIINDICLYNHFQDNLCFFKVGDIVTVEKLRFNESNEINRQEITSGRIYVRSDVVALNIWYNKIILLTYHHIFVCKYNIDCDINTPPSVVPIKKHSFSLLDEGEKMWMFQNDIVFNLRSNVLQVIVFSKKINKKFNCLQNISGKPIKISYHASVLFIVTVYGSTFTYYVDDWNNFDLHNYVERVDRVVDTIKDIDIVEQQHKSKLVTIHTKGIYFINYKNT